MSRIDVMKSLLRSAAGGASGGLDRLSQSKPMRKLVGELLKGGKLITDAQLTAAVARAPGTLAATVSTHPGGLRIDASFDDGSSLLLCLCPEGVTFAQHGAKELRVRVEPSSAAVDAHASDAFVAIAGEIARALWGPLLIPQTDRSKLTSVQRAHDVLILDLRSLAEVRAALRQRLRATGMEAFALQALLPEDGGLRLVPKLPGR